MDNAILKIDHDARPFPRRDFDRRVMLLAKELGAKRADIALAKTARGTHAYIYLDGVELTDAEIVAAQLYLGSDRHRELFNLGRVHRQERGWNVLFNRKWRGEHLVGAETQRRAYTINIQEEEE